MITSICKMLASSKKRFTAISQDLKVGSWSSLMVHVMMEGIFLQEFNAVVRESARSQGPVNGRGCKYFVNATMMVFDVKGMSREVPMETLKDLIFVLLSKLLDENAHRALEENPDILKAVNILMLKMISNNFG